MQIDLNCDMGESFGRYTLGEDAAMLDIVTSANIACGMHAGDPMVMARTVEMAAEKGVGVGAHPGYPDLQGFGRRMMALTPAELYANILYQISALSGFARAAGVPLAHVKLHGALYNYVAGDRELSIGVAQTLATFDPNLIVVTLPNSMLAVAARSVGLRVAGEGFADRAYHEDGMLAPRSEPGAVIHDPKQTTERAVRMVTHSEVKTIDGKAIPMNIDTLCIHGDTPGAANIARALRSALRAAGIEIKAMGQ